MELSIGAKTIINTLNQSGYKGYAVGGFVRNNLLSLPVGDLDITTDATPDKVIEIFKDYKVYPTGLKHGTVTINVNGENIEVTTFRVESGYNDNRHPDSVEFVSRLDLDLMRRDFTINAMAFDGNELVDLFGGQVDLKNKIIRAVGDAETRFEEDALRILRALRFASVLDFTIEENTARAIEKKKHLLSFVSKERIFAELTKTLLGKGVERVLTLYKSVIFEVIPKLKLCDNFNQNSKFHAYDVYTHIVKSVAESKADRVVRWALLLHDVEKPSTYNEGINGVGHFYGHQKKSAETAVVILKRLKADNELINECKKIINLHDSKTEISRGEIKVLLNKYGVKTIRYLVDVKIGDAISHAQPYADIRKENTIVYSKTIEDIISSDECFTLKRLAVNGNDLIKLGYKGSEIKEKLNSVLYDVMFNKIKNDRQIIIERLKNERGNRAKN